MKRVSNTGLLDRGTAKDVVGIVLTHNAPDALRRCVLSLLAQELGPGHILVVDNASAMPAELALGSLCHGREDVTVLRCEENGGPAGGHAAGLRWFLDTEYHYAWVMDDDCEPQAGCLSTLLSEAAQSDDSALIFPTWVDASTGRIANYPAWCGLIIPREIVESVGLPMMELFWWAEDTEYLKWRIPRAGHGTRRAAAAIVYHHKDRRAAVKPDWKIYYEVRNSLYYKLYVQRPQTLKRRLKLVRSIGRLGIHTFFVQPSPRRIALFFRALTDGWSGKLGKTVPVP